MVINDWTAMIEQMNHANGHLTVDEQLEAALQEIRELRAKLDMRPKLLSPSEYARMHRVSKSTVNRALNHELGYQLKGYAESRIVGHHQNGSPVVRWYIDPDARIVHQKAKK